MKVSKGQSITLLFLMLLSSFTSFEALSQSIVSGIVTETNGTPIVGANVYLDGTYDGASSNDAGAFNFETTETGVQTLTVSFVSFETP